MSLKALANETLVRLRGTEAGTLLEQVEHPEECSNGALACSKAMEHDFSQKSKENDACSTVPFPRVGTDGTCIDLSGDILLGLKRLGLMPTPRIKRPELWNEIKSDGLRIATEGWAAQAIALGWDPLQIFGYQSSDDPDEFGLAVELAGRTIVAVDERRFYLRRDKDRSFFVNQPRSLLTRYLWDFDR